MASAPGAARGASAAGGGLGGAAVGSAAAAAAGVQSSADVRASLPRAVPDSTTTGRCVPRSGQYVSCGHTSSTYPPAPVVAVVPPRAKRAVAQRRGAVIRISHVPFGHTTHASSAPTEYVPLSHSLIALGSVSDGHENPGGHFVHFTCPASADSPGTQSPCDAAFRPGSGTRFPASHIVRFALPMRPGRAPKATGLEFVLGQLYASHVVHAVALPTAKAPSAHGAGSKGSASGTRFPPGHRIQCVWFVPDPSPTPADTAPAARPERGTGTRPSLRHIVSRPTSVTLRRWSCGASVVFVRHQVEAALLAVDAIRRDLHPREQPSPRRTPCTCSAGTRPEPPFLAVRARRGRPTNPGRTPSAWRRSPRSGSNTPRGTRRKIRSPRARLPGQALRAARGPRGGVQTRGARDGLGGTLAAVPVAPVPGGALFTCAHV